MATELRDYIEVGIERIGTLTELAKRVGVSRTSLTDAKAHKHGIPAASCVVLAEIVGVEAIAVIAASELVTETKEEKRAVWLPFVTARGGGEGGIRTHGTFQYA